MSNISMASPQRPRSVSRSHFDMPVLDLTKNASVYFADLPLKLTYFLKYSTPIVAKYFFRCKRITCVLFSTHSCNAFAKNGNLCGRSLLSFNTMRASPKTGSTALGCDF